MLFKELIAVYIENYTTTKYKIELPLGFETLVFLNTLSLSIYFDIRLMRKFVK